MRDEATAVDIHAGNIGGSVQIQPHMRLLHGLRKPANWLQLVRFGFVGGLGFVVNLAVYTLCVHALGIDYHLAAIAAWLVAVVNNFVLNRHWTFDAREGRVHFQAVRFVVVSLVALGFSLLILVLLVEAVGARQGARRRPWPWRLRCRSTSSATSCGAFGPRPRVSPVPNAERGRLSRSAGLGGYLYSGLSPSRRICVQEMVIYGVSFDMVGKQPIVLLKTVDGNKFLPIWIGHPEAASILMKLQGAGTPRPMTHDLLCDILGELDVKCTQVSVTELRENTFFASITLSVAGRELEILEA